MAALVVSCLVMPEARAQRVMSVRDFTTSIGINTHLNYLDTAYGDDQMILSDLQWLGVDQLRDNAPAPWIGGSADRAVYEDLARRGVRFDFIVRGDGGAIAASVAEIDAVARAVPGSVMAVEGFNEIDHNPVSFGGKTGVSGGLAGQMALYLAVRRARRLAQVPVYALTGVPPSVLSKNFGVSYDFGNLHVYAQNGEQPSPPDNVGDLWIAAAVDHARRGRLDLPLVMTEFGYFSLPQSGWYNIGVDEVGQAKGLLNGLCDAARLGISKSFIYELIDEHPDPDGSHNEDHYGLFNFDHTPKRAAMSLRNFLLIFRRGVPSRGEIHPHLTQAPDSVGRLELIQASGAIDLVLWNEAEFWDHAAGQAVVAAPVAVQLDVGGAQVQYRIYDPLDGDAPILAGEMERTNRVSVPDHPIIVELAAPSR